MSKILNGKKLALEIKSSIREAVINLNDKGVFPGLATIIVGDDPASRTYINNKIKASNEVGIKSFHYDLDKKIEEKKIINLINKLNDDDKVDGILVQLPLSNHINTNKVIDSINSEKDVDGFSIKNTGKIFLNREGIIPCTPKGCLLLLESTNISFEGKKAVIVGRSNIVGKPMSQLLLNKNCTVTIAHSRTKNLNKITKEADIIVAAVGKPKIIKKNGVKKGAIVIDVGINRIVNNEKTYLVGDVDFSEVSKLASFITPVPGGVGPMTIACLLLNTVVLSSKKNNIDLSSHLGQYV